MSKFFLNSIRYLKGVDKKQAVRDEIKALKHELSTNISQDLDEQIQEDISELEEFLESC